MNVTPLKLQGASLLEPVVHGDNRGFFMESYNEEIMHKAGVNFNFIQDNQSLSAEVGVLRGLHYQLNPKAQTKLIRVLSGAIYDVILDVRRNSSTFGQWVGVILSEYNKRQLLVPRGSPTDSARSYPTPKYYTKWTNIIPLSMTVAYYGMIRRWGLTGRLRIRCCPTKTGVFHFSRMQN